MFKKLGPKHKNTKYQVIFRKKVPLAGILKIIPLDLVVKLLKGQHWVYRSVVALALLAHYKSNPRRSLSVIFGKSLVGAVLCSSQSIEIEIKANRIGAVRVQTV